MKERRKKKALWLMRSFPRLESTVWTAERQGGWGVGGGVCARACGEGGENGTFVWVTIFFCVCVCVVAVEESRAIRPIQRDKKYLNCIRVAGEGGKKGSRCHEIVRSCALSRLGGWEEVNGGGGG